MINEKRLLLILATVQFCHIIDFMIVMPLGKTIMNAFDITPGQFAWVVSAYALAAFTGNLVSTVVIDRFDRRSALLFLFTCFTAGTLACAFAPTYGFLLAARFGTGLFGGTLGALVLAVVGDVIPLERRASAMGWVMTAFSAASVIGVPAGIWIAAEYSWHAPFYATAALAGLFVTIAFFFVPSMRGHLVDQTIVPEGDQSEIGDDPEAQLLQPRSWSGKIADPFRAIFTNANQRAALLFTLTLMLGHFTIIPFIAPYMQINVGFADKQVSLIYLIGGALTVILLPLFGRLADRFGRLRVFTISSVLALFSIYALTNLDTNSIPVALLVTSSFFVVASGRNVPATTMITSVVRPENRGGFMSIRQSVNEMALFFSSVVAGFVITEGPDGKLEHYELLGYFTIFMSIVAVFTARRVRAVA
ncbi:putative MFS family arabinose efflux permease [Neolewinella xylanilytica]|uniref:Putative MFS family arabinose efflux permease n=1 Tax=Neolewinella xylanilytica TaxID=1514080 RepID=A0A2S6I7E1_9BACT|nr:MFS transporter [Neolewinella xylanilytica]PPK87432.1 putative MFS family arabinose efflux permease [Neolewinella xylanilytica]